MIKQTERITDNGTVLCGYLRSAWNAYGPHHSFLRFFADDDGGQLSIMDGVATVCWHEHVDELAMFLAAQPDVHTVRCDVFVAEKLRQVNDTVTVRPIMCCKATVTACGAVTVPSLRTLYPLLTSAFDNMPPFDRWYVDVSHRMRHGCCHIAAVQQEDKTVSSAMTVAEWESGAVIGAVATHGDYRRRGYAACCVTALTAQMQSEGKHVFICPKNETARHLYETLGFDICGELALLERN